MNKPDFICIGASKAGTTWLHRHLMGHEEIWLPFVKELHYFDHKHVRRWVDVIAKSSVFGRVVRAAILEGLVRGEFLWSYQYLFKERLADTYYKLFEGRGNNVTGEITPAYAMLSEHDISEIARVQSDCKIIYILREPAERTWSHLNMIRKRGGKSLTDEELYARLNHKHLTASDYLSHLSNWEKYFPAKQIHIGFYDELRTNPISFLNKIYIFLEVSQVTEKATKRKLRKKVNGGYYKANSTGIPISLREYFQDELVKINAKFNNEYTQKWLLDYERKTKIKS